ncbi:MAG: hypothetical protein ACE5HU_07060 [Acidobacteriota bacterium]
MKAISRWLLVWAVVFQVGDALVSPAPGREQPVKQRGMSWVGGDVVSEAQLRRLVDLGVDWIVQTPFGWQKSLDSPEVVLATSGRVFWGETDEGLVTTARMARRLGIRTMLKPHIWLHGGSHGAWRGKIAMANEEDWRRWFHSYGRFIMHYARLAQESGMEALCIGTELHVAAREREQDWRELIKRIRAVYHGKLLYAANWYREFEEVAFWDMLDFIGIQAYFPLCKVETPTVEQLKEGWRRHLPAIERVQKKFDKPVIFTEIGYRSSPDATIEPWTWPARGGREASTAGLTTQANGYEAFFETFWHEPWFAGAYFWKWYPKVSRGYHFSPAGFTPQNKPAEKTIASWYLNGRSPKTPASER